MTNKEAAIQSVKTGYWATSSEGLLFIDGKPYQVIADGEPINLDNNEKETDKQASGNRKY